MSTVVYQGLQSCLGTQPVEQRTLRLKLASPKPISDSILPDSNNKQNREKCHCEEGGCETNSPLDSHSSSSPDMGGWRFIYALSNGCQGQKWAMEKQKQSPYVHPLVKKSASSLSDKSLEMCTEDLGSETGTHAVENSMFDFPSSASEDGGSSSRDVLKPRQPLRARKENSQNFPPPLTTISGSNSLQIRPHREDGRLIMEAVKAPPVHTIFQVERSEGRLRLCLWKDPISNLDWQAAAKESEGCSDANEREEIENEVEKDEEDIEEEEDEDDDDGKEKEDSEEFNWGEEMEGKNREVEVEMGREKYRRPSRCKEGDGGHERKGLLIGSLFGWLLPKACLWISQNPIPTNFSLSLLLFVPHFIFSSLFSILDSPVS